MADDTQNPTTDDTQAAVAQQPTTPVVTPELQAMIDGAVKRAADEAAERARNAAWAEARKKYERKQPEQEPQKPQPRPENQSAPAGITPDDVTQMIARESKIVRAIERNGLNEDQEHLLRAALKASSVDEFDAVLERTAKVFGGGSNKNPQPQQPASPTEAAKPAQPAPPAVFHPAPAGTPTTDASNVFGWSRDQVAAYIRSKGAVGSDPYDRRNRGAWHELRKMAEAQGATVRVTPPDGDRG